MRPLAGRITLIDMNFIAKFLWRYQSTCCCNQLSSFSAFSCRFNIGVANPAAFTYQILAQPTVGASPTVYPQRFGHAECEYYMKTGECKYGAQCRFHHPIDRPAVALSTTKPSQQENVKLMLAGLPSTEGAIICVYYLKTSTCKI